mmetsp:Transcript_59852/g.165580  ORF Transcript_59852/g.165580 Transcript_59852/m.165580 type:complete len:318 (-) Transcript_59852:472-1425(-)
MAMTAEEESAGSAALRASAAAATSKALTTSTRTRHQSAIAAPISPMIAWQREKYRSRTVLAHQSFFWVNSSNSRRSCMRAASTLAAEKAAVPSRSWSSSARVATTSSSASAGSHSKPMLMVPFRGRPRWGGESPMSSPTETEYTWPRLKRRTSMRRVSSSRIRRRKWNSSRSSASALSKDPAWVTARRRMGKQSTVVPLGSIMFSRTSSFTGLGGKVMSSGVRASRIASSLRRSGCTFPSSRLGMDPRYLSMRGIKTSFGGKRPTSTNVHSHGLLRHLLKIALARLKSSLRMLHRLGIRVKGWFCVMQRCRRRWNCA